VAVAEREESALHATDERLAHPGLAHRGLDTAAAPAQRLAAFRTARLEKPRDSGDSLMKYLPHTD
jgi:hypothetical protein